MCLMWYYMTNQIQFLCHLNKIKKKISAKINPGPCVYVPLVDVLRNTGWGLEGGKPCRKDTLHIYLRTLATCKGDRPPSIRNNNNNKIKKNSPCCMRDDAILFSGIKNGQHQKQCALCFLLHQDAMVMMRCCYGLIQPIGFWIF